MKKITISLLSTMMTIAVISCGRDASSTPNSRSASNQALITSFTIEGQAGEALINDEAGTIILSIPIGSELINLSPSITVSERASILPASGIAQDFSYSISRPLPYTVTAEDGTTKAYRVTVGIFPVITYSTYDENRLGAGDLYKADLFGVSNIEDGSTYNYSITLGNYTREGSLTATGNTFSISLIDLSSMNDGSDQVGIGDDGDVILSVLIDEEQYFSETINKEQYSLRTAKDIQGIQHDLSGDYTLMNDIDMMGIDFMPIAYDTNASSGHQGRKFSGSINGNGYTISNLTITYDNRYIGFISYGDTNAELNNIALSSINIISAEAYSAGLVG